MSTSSLSVPVEEEDGKGGDGRGQWRRRRTTTTEEVMARSKWVRGGLYQPPLSLVSEIRGTEIGGRNKNRWAAGVATLRIIYTLYLEASTAAQPAIKQSRAQRRRVDAIALAVQIPIPTSFTCKTIDSGGWRCKLKKRFDEWMVGCGDERGKKK